MADTEGTRTSEIVQDDEVVEELDADADELGEELGPIAPGSYAAVFVWENTWAAPIAAALRRNGGQLNASGRIPTQALIASMQTDGD